MQIETPTKEQIARAVAWAKKRVCEVAASPDGTEFAMLHGDIEALDVLATATARHLVDDPRPENVAELAAEVARELRKRGIWARVGDTVNACAVRVPRPADRMDRRWYSMFSPDFDNLGPIAIANAIVAMEAKRAQEWAGDT